MRLYFFFFNFFGGVWGFLKARSQTSNAKLAITKQVQHTNCLLNAKVILRPRVFSQVHFTEAIRITYGFSIAVNCLMHGTYKQNTGQGSLYPYSLLSTAFLNEQEIF